MDDGSPAVGARAPRPRSLFVLNGLCVGGAETQVVALVNGLSRLRHEVFLQCLKNDTTLLPQVAADRRAQVLPALGVRRGLAGAAVRALAARMDALSVDLLVCTNMYALLYGWLARAFCARRHHVKLVVVFHTTDVGSRKERLAMVLYRLLVRSVDLLVYVCKGQAAHWRALGLQARREVVIYNGVDTARFTDRWGAADKAGLRARHRLDASDFVVGLCAVMRPEKAHVDLLQALVVLRNQGVRIKALLIGDGPLRAEIEREVVAGNLGDSVRITGMLDDVRPAIAVCDVMVLTSHAVETFSMAALEAMSLGKPMVMTHIGGADEQVVHGRHGLLYPAGNVPALAAALIDISGQGRAAAMGARASARVHARFGVDRMVHGYADALDALAREG